PDDRRIPAEPATPERMTENDHGIAFERGFISGSEEPPGRGLDPEGLEEVGRHDVDEEEFGRTVRPNHRRAPSAARKHRGERTRPVPERLVFGVRPRSVLVA